MMGCDRSTAVGDVWSLIVVVIVAAIESRSTFRLADEDLDRVLLTGVVLLRPEGLPLDEDRERGLLAPLSEDDGELTDFGGELLLFFVASQVLLVSLTSTVRSINRLPLLGMPTCR